MEISPYPVWTAGESFQSKSVLSCFAFGRDRLRIKLFSCVQRRLDSAFIFLYKYFSLFLNCFSSSSLFSIIIINLQIMKNFLLFLYELDSNFSLFSENLETNFFAHIKRFFLVIIFIFYKNSFTKLVWSKYQIVLVYNHSIKRLWFKGRIDRCHRLDPGSSPGRRTF